VFAPNRLFAKASENGRLERANGQSPDREQNTYEQGTSSRANDGLNIGYFCLGHWVFAITVAIEANGCFKQTTEIPSDGHPYTDYIAWHSFLIWPPVIQDQ